MRRAAPVLALALALTLAPPARAEDPFAALIREVEGLMAGHTDRAKEARILELLRRAAPETLDRAVRHLDLGKLLGDVDDHPGGPQHRTDLLLLLGRARLRDLSIAGREALITALQRGRTGSRREQVIRDVLLGTRGAALTALKNAIDAGGDPHDLEQLVFHDLDDAALRDQVLAHFAREAAAAPSGEVKVLSDIDDTLYRNWVDERYPPKAVYPGVRALYHELDIGPDEAGRPGDLVFVTARPGDRAGIVEEQTIATLGRLGLSRFVVLTGSLSKVVSNEAIARGKLEAIDRYRRLFPEYGFVFLGDSGQGDALVAAALMADHAGTTRAVFIHDVVTTPPEGRAAWAERGVPLFDTYVGAAVHALEQGLISPAGLRRVVAAAREELEALPFPDEAVRAARREELLRDVARAEALAPGGD
ncbi:MAG: App1 family protein [Planctomycetes bacterium]|nr:App1 family protein [Planctomycetota bacterium]